MTEEARRGLLQRLVPSLLRQPGPFRVFWAGQTISLFGDQVSLIGISLTAVLVLRAGPAEMGALVAAGWLPSLLFALHAGAWVDRTGHRRRIMIAADLARAAMLLTVPAAAALHVMTLVHLFAVVFLNGSLSVLFNVSTQALFVSTVPRDRYVEGQSLLHGSRAFSFVGGSSVGGLLVQAVTAPGALVADAASFLVSAASLGMIAPREPEIEQRRRGVLLSGLRFVFGTPVTRAALGATATINLFQLAYSALAVLYIVEELHVAPAVLGLVLGAGSVGALIGSMLAGRLARRVGIGRAFLIGCILFPAPLVLTPLAGGPMALVLAMLFAAQFGAGLGVVILDISIGSIFAALIPDQLRSRVTGAYTVVNYGVRPLGSLMGGALGAALGVRPTLLAMAISAVAGFLWLLPSPIPRMAALPPPAEAS